MRFSRVDQKRARETLWFSRARVDVIVLNYLADLDSQVLPEVHAAFSVQAFFSLMTDILPAAALSVQEDFSEVQAAFSEHAFFSVMTDMLPSAALSVQAALSLQHALPEDFWLAVQPPMRAAKANKPAAVRATDFFMGLSEK